MEKIQSTMVIHKHLYEAYTILSAMERPLLNNTLEKCLGLIIRRTYQAVSEDISWAYEPVSWFWPDIDPDSDSSDGGLINEGSKYQENSYYQ